jgi:RNA-splicing ligase RtcB
VERLEEINCHHNYTEQEEHFGRKVWLSRKGATNAEEGRDGLIPGSMGTASYVVRGRGHVLALKSAPHGAGREYSRSRARKTFTATELREAMAGIEYRDTDAFIAEIPAAYRGHRPGHGRCRGPGRGPAHAAPDRQRQGRLTPDGRRAVPGDPRVLPGCP